MQGCIYLESLDHRGKHFIAIRCPLGPAECTKIRNHPRRLYSKTHGCWYLPYSEEDMGWLRQVLNVEDRTRNGGPNATTVKGPTHASTITSLQLSEGYHEMLVRVRYSEATVKTQESQLRLFLAWLHPRLIQDITEANINDYLLFVTEVKKVSISTQNTAINAIKFYLEKVHHGERKVYYVDRPMKETKLPRVLSQEEVKLLIGSTKNVKHWCMIMLLYATGIRMSELLNLRWKDFDEQRLQLFVDGGKGRKDRMTIISKSALAYIKYYMTLYKTKDYLFEGPGGSRYSPRSVNKVIHSSEHIAGISKPVSAH